MNWVTSKIPSSFEIFDVKRTSSLWKTNLSYFPIKIVFFNIFTKQALTLFNTVCWKLFRNLCFHQQKYHRFLLHWIFKTIQIIDPDVLTYKLNLILKKFRCIFICVYIYILKNVVCFPNFVLLFQICLAFLCALYFRWILKSVWQFQYKIG